MAELWSRRGVPQSLCVICGRYRSLGHDWNYGHIVGNTFQVAGLNLRLSGGTLHAYVPFDEELP